MKSYAFLASAAIGALTAPSGASAANLISVPFTSTISEGLTSLLAPFALSGNGGGSARNVGLKVVTTVKAGDGQSFTDVLIDTGSAITWVEGYKPGPHTKPFNTTFSIAYGEGYANGTEYTDKVSVGGATASAALIGAAKYTDGFQLVQPINGILGLGPTGSNLDEVAGYNTTPTFVETLHSEGVIDEPTFSILVNPLSSTGNPEGTGELSFGGVDQSKIEGNISWVPAVEPYDLHWQFNVTSMSFANQTITSGPTFARTDTGFLFIGVPIDSIEAIVNVTNSTIGVSSLLAGCLVFPQDSSVESLPPLIFEVADLAITIPASSYLVPESWYPALNITSQDAEQGRWSFVASAGFSEFDLGSVWLSHVYTAYDMAKHRIGFALPKAANSEI